VAGDAAARIAQPTLDPGASRDCSGSVEQHGPPAEMSIYPDRFHNSGLRCRSAISDFPVIVAPPQDWLHPLQHGRNPAITLVGDLHRDPERHFTARSIWAKIVQADHIAC